MALFKFQSELAKEQQGSFGEQLLKALATTALTAGVRTGIEGGLGGYLSDLYKQKGEAREQDWSKQLHDRALTDQAEAASQKNVQQIAEDMPDPTIQAGMRQVIANKGNSGKQTMTGAGPNAGPQTPGAVGEELGRRTDMFWQQNPELRKLYQLPKDSRAWFGKMGDTMGKGGIEGNKLGWDKEKFGQQMDFNYQKMAQDKDFQTKKLGAMQNIAKIKADAVKNNQDWRKDPRLYPIVMGMTMAFGARMNPMGNMTFGDEELAGMYNFMSKQLGTAGLPQVPASMDSAATTPPPDATSPGAGPAPEPAPAATSPGAAQAVTPDRIKRAEAYFKNKNIPITEDLGGWITRQNPDSLKKMGI